MEANVIVDVLDMGFDFSLFNDIRQNVKTIITTPAGTVPFDREFGVRAEFLDAPMAYAASLILSEYMTKIRRYEPRVKKLKISFTAGLDGCLVPEVIITHVAD